MLRETNAFSYVYHFYQTYIRYAFEVWNGCTHFELNSSGKINCMQLNCYRIVTGLPTFSSNITVLWNRMGTTFQFSLKTFNYIIHTKFRHNCILNIIHTKFRHNCIFNNNLFRRNIIGSLCYCDHVEDTNHFFFSCTWYNQRNHLLKLTLVVYCGVNNFYFCSYSNSFD